MMLCIDPGLGNIGAVIVDPRSGALVAAHHFATEKMVSRVRWRHSDDKARRVGECARFYAELIRSMDIKRCAAELPSGGAPNSPAACDLAYSAACLVSVMEVLGVACEWYAPREVKLAAVGRSSASKREVISAICDLHFPELRQQFPDVGRLEHVCDAAAVWLAARHGALAKL
jgi:Holliday junction resolvasome RuvABC endonuclease subunit